MNSSLHETSSFCTGEITRQTYKKYFKAIEESEVEIKLLLQLQHYFSQDRKKCFRDNEAIYSLVIRRKYII